MCLDCNIFEINIKYHGEETHTKKRKKRKKKPLNKSVFFPQSLIAYDLCLFFFPNIPSFQKMLRQLLVFFKNIIGM